MSVPEQLLTSASAVMQDFYPLKNVCAHLNAFHAYADDPGRSVEANHYCSIIDEDVRQCLLYDSAEKNARLLGVEYMISPRLFDGLPADEQRLWHSHVYEVKSGMLVMPNRLTPDSAWEVAERKEMEHVIKLYGKAYHMWQVDKGHNVPLGEPQLMTSFTTDGQLDFSKVKDRDSRLGTSFQNRKEARANIPEPSVHPNADSAWQKKKFGV